MSGSDSSGPILAWLANLVSWTQILALPADLIWHRHELIDFSVPVLGWLTDLGQDQHRPVWFFGPTWMGHSTWLVCSLLESSPRFRLAVKEISENTTEDSLYATFSDLLIILMIFTRSDKRQCFLFHCHAWSSASSDRRGGVWRLRSEGMGSLSSYLQSCC